MDPPRVALVRDPVEPNFVAMTERTEVSVSRSREREGMRGSQEVSTRHGFRPRRALFCLDLYAITCISIDLSHFEDNLHPPRSARSSTSPTRRTLPPSSSAEEGSASRRGARSACDFDALGGGREREGPWRTGPRAGRRSSRSRRRDSDEGRRRTSHR